MFQVTHEDSLRYDKSHTIPCASIILEVLVWICSFNSSGANTILPLQVLPQDRDVSSLAYVLVDSHDAFIIRMCDIFI